MRSCRHLILAALAVLACGGPACTREAASGTTNAVDAAIAETKASADIALDATRDGADRALDATKEGIATAADKTREVAATAGEAITDAWITTKVSAQLLDETLLKGSHVNVDTEDHVVSLKGTVLSAAAKKRAGDVARGTEGVTRVVNQVVVQ
jgi:hypothetical protein